MTSEIQEYNGQLPEDVQGICDALAEAIDKNLNLESKVWHAHPVWFSDGNPLVGYSLQKAGVRLMFWSGADFEEEKLNVLGKNFRDASIFYQELNQIDFDDLNRWLEKAKIIQWDYKNIVKRKGKLIRIV